MDVSCSEFSISVFLSKDNFQVGEKITLK